MIQNIEVYFLENSCLGCVVYDKWACVFRKNKGVR